MSGVLSETSTRGSSQTEENRKNPILSSRIDHPLCKFSGFSPVWGDKDHNNQDVLSATKYQNALYWNTTTIYLLDISGQVFYLQRFNFLSWPVVQFFFSKLKLPFSFHFKIDTDILKLIDQLVFRLYYYFLSFTHIRNQRMAEDQSVVGRRRIYYDQHGSEALICSDSEEELTEPEEEKHEFSEAEDRVIW